jgi:hypothetical protein
MVRWDGGVGRVLSEIKPFFEKAGHTVEIISREDDLNCNSTIKSIRKIRKIIKSKKYDILFTQDWSCALPLITFKNHYCFFHGHSVGKEFFFQYIVGKLMGKRLITGDFKNKEIFGCPLVPNGVNIEKFKQLNKKRSYLGWINKKTETLEKKDILELGKKLKMPVLVAEGIPPEKMNEFYNKCEVFLSLPPKQAGCQLSYMEAMASGIPRMVGNKNGEGFKYPFEKVEDFKDIETAIKNSKKRDYRKFIIDKGFTWEEQANKFMKIWTGGNKK